MKNLNERKLDNIVNNMVNEEIDEFLNNLFGGPEPSKRERPKNKTSFSKGGSSTRTATENSNIFHDMSKPETMFSRFKRDRKEDMDSFKSNERVRGKAEKMKGMKSKNNKQMAGSWAMTKDVLAVVDKDVKRLKLSEEDIALAIEQIKNTIMRKYNVTTYGGNPPSGSKNQGNPGKKNSDSITSKASNDDLDEAIRRVVKRYIR